MEKMHLFHWLREVECFLPNTMAFVIEQVFVNYSSLLLGLINIGLYYMEIYYSTYVRG
jgi:hypothetical protein